MQDSVYGDKLLPSHTELIIFILLVEMMKCLHSLSLACTLIEQNPDGCNKKKLPGKSNWGKKTPNIVNL